MSRLSPQTLLAVLLGVVPLAVLCAGAVSFLLLRAGYNFVVSGVLPFLGLLVVVAILGLVLGRAARGRKPQDGKSRRRNDV